MVYTNAFSTLKVGRVRYGLMCGDDGMVFDDGTTARLGENHYLMTTTTGNAAHVLEWLEEWLQTEWPELKVYCTSVTEQWATVALAGPKARDVLATVAPELALDTESFPFMSVKEGIVAGVNARVFRISFTGELSFEINVPWHHGRHLWEALMQAGAEHGITPYGTEAMHVLRAERGFIIVGQETDGTTTPQDLGMDWIVSKKKPDFLGKRAWSREDTRREDRKQLVGILTNNPSSVLPEGTQLVDKPGRPPLPMIGHVTSSYASPTLGRSIALALVKGGRARIGETIHAAPESGFLPARSRSRCSTIRKEPSAMAEAAAPRSPLAALADALAEARAGDTVLVERPARTRLNLRLDPDDADTLTAAGAALGGALPLTPNTTAVTARGWTLLWLGPNEWLATGPAAEGAALADALRRSLDSKHHALTDVSAMYATLALSGPRAREVLMKGCRLDLHPRAFAPGACVQTALARAQMILHQTDDGPTYEITVRNSFAHYLATWLLDAMAEYRPA